jgi:hypothetical protein
MLGVSDEVLYITAENLVRTMANEIKVNSSNSGIGGVNEDCFNKVANLMNWTINLRKVNVKLDVVMTIITDLSSSLGEKFSAIVISDEFDEVCPAFVEFCGENSIIF